MIYQHRLNPLGRLYLTFLIEFRSQLEVLARLLQLNGQQLMNKLSLQPHLEGMEPPPSFMMGMNHFPSQ